MGSRKRAKPNPAVESSAPSPSTTMPSLLPAKSSQSHTPVAEDATTSTTPNTSTSTSTVDHGTPRASKPNRNGGSTPVSVPGAKSVHKTRSWYGSWPRVPKSAASTQVARETILGGTSKPNATADFSRFETKKSVDSMSIYEGRSPAPTLSKIHEDGSDTDNGEPGPAPPVVEDVANTESETKPEDVDVEMTGGDEEQGPEPSPEQPLETPAEQQPPAEPTPQRPASGWFGWFGRPATTEATAPAMDQEAAQKTDQATDQETIPTTDQAVSKPAPISEPAPQEPTTVEVNVPETEPPKSNSDAQSTQQVTESVESSSQPAAQGNAVAAYTYGASWLWSWSSRSAPVPAQPEQAPAQPEQASAQPEQVAPPAEPEAPPPVNETEDVVMQDAPAAKPASEPPAAPPKSGSTWAFWSRDTSSPSGKEKAQKEEQGQLAVMGESSETHPKRANSMEFKGALAKEPPLKPGPKGKQAKADTAPSRQSSSSSKRNKQVSPQSMDIDGASPAQPSTPKADTTKANTTKADTTKADATKVDATKTDTTKADTTPKAGVSKAPTSAKALPPNLLLPSFSSTYKLKENPSIMQQITQLLLRTRQSSAKHVYLAKEPPKIKKALAIGVHGLFPANYLRTMIGQPTGTSIKFANHCAEAVRRWANSHGCEDCEIEKVALEGEGRIGERVENLWKLLLNWIDDIRNADLILIACHSQGVPVSIMLLAKLIELGVVTGAKVGVCAMAGVSLGPFPDYRSSMGILMGSAAELWEFADPQSEVSKRLEASVKAVLNYGARLTYVGSIDDQLVPVESAIYAPAHHPYIYRAVFIDGRIHAPDFIAHLVGFALKLRNLGVSDHGLIRELSTPLAGSLYSGEGHSRLYDDEQVYDLAVTHALETTNVAAPPDCEVHHRQAGGGLSNPNPYHLPWIMRGLLEEDFVKTELSAETAELVRQFDDWKPVTKALKDVKYRLEAVRSKL